MNGMMSFKSLIALITLVALTACGGGSGSGSTSLSIGTFFKTYHIDDNGYGAYPFSDAQDAKIQLLYTAAEINGSGNLTALRFRRDSDASQVNCPNTTIRLGHTNLTTLNATFANNVEQGQGSLVTVLDNAAVTIPAGSTGEWFDISLTKSFAYNGVDNLVVEMEQFTACSARIRMDLSFPIVDRRVRASAIDTTPGTADHNQTTGTLESSLYWMQFVFAGGDNEILQAAAASSNLVPFSTGAGFQKLQQLVLAPEINGSGPITGIAFRMRELDPVDNTPGGDYTVNVRMAHTTLSELTNTFADNYDLGAPVDVANSLSFSIPAGIPAGGYVWVPLTGTFSYNGSDNLIVEVEVLSASASNLTWAPNAGVNNHLYGAVGSTVGTLSLFSHDIKLRFNGGTMDVGLPSSFVVNLVFDDTVDGAAIQNLYRAVDLGTGGLIDSIGVRLVNDSVAAVHSSYTIRMGHTFKTALNPADTYASNMDEDLTVYSGSFSIPAGLKAGDWVTIPLSAGFTYDATKNLAILFSTLGGAASANDVQIKGGLRYSSSVSGSGAGSDTVPSELGNAVVVTRLHIQK